jgi:putative nucleotidyltransferase with HDIG domain
MRGHAERLTRLAMRLAAEVGLGENEIETIRLGALLHDVGKIGIPDSVLLKPSALTDEERLLMRAHTEIGDHLLEPLELLAAVRPIVRHHHERWDGLGYPDRLSGSAIPLGARIMSVADAVDAMSASRVYRAALPQVEVVRELERGRGTQWDPALVDHTLKLIESGAVSFAPDGLEIAESSPGAAVLRFPGPNARRNRRRHLGEAAQ